MTIKVFSVAEMVAAEKAADASGVSYDEMMENAGRLLAEAIIERYPVEERNVLVLVGPGNNGGDGLVAGRYLAEAGADVAFYLYRPREAGEDHNFARIVEMGLFHANAGDDQRYRVLRLRLDNSDIVVDALLGTGVDRPIGGELATLLRQVHAGLAARREEADQAGSPLTSVAAVTGPGNGDAHPVVVAVDCPSGLNADTGELDRLALAADLTVTFAGPKRGHFIFPGAAALGELVVADIDISADLSEVAAVPLSLVTAAAARVLLPPRPADGHKGTFGKVLIAAGSDHYWGAPLLCGRGAYRSGAGLVALAVPATVRPVVAGQLPEATYPPIAATSNFDEEAAHALQLSQDDYEAFLFGPGLGNAAAFVGALLAMADDLPPLVVDADGLNLLAEMEGWAQRLPPNTILTPHPGEMARLCGLSLGELLARDRVDLAREMARAWGHVLLLKGAHTVIAAPDGRAALQPFANPVLSGAGSGDVLAGVIVGLLGQGMEPYEAAVLGAYLHGAAGQLAGEEIGNAGVLSGEIADWIPAARHSLLPADERS